MDRDGRVGSPFLSSWPKAGTTCVFGVRFNLQRAKPSLRANGSRECAPDDRLDEAIHQSRKEKIGLLRRFAPRNDVGLILDTTPPSLSVTPSFGRLH
jgi:hypothetical protein